YEANGKLDEARTAYGEAIALAPDLPALYRLRGRLLIEMKKENEAMKDLDTAGRPGGSARSREGGGGHFQRASLLRRAGKLKEAIRACEQAAFAFPAFAAPYRLHGEILFGQEKFADAILLFSLYLEASKRDPSSPPPPASVYRARALAQVRLGKPGE